MSARDADMQLIPALLEQPQGFDLFQAISLLERAGMADGHAALGTDYGTEAVRLSSHISLDFDASDVRDVGHGAATGEPFTLRTPVLSLLGQAGPMPAAFTEMVIARNAVRDFATAEFLDIFHHRLLSLFYLGRKRHRPSVGGDANSASVGSATRRLCGSTEQIPSDAGRWLRHAGLLAGAPRSMASLCTLLEDRFQITFRGEQFVGRWLPLESDDLTHLGDAARAPVLGQTALLGRQAWDQSAAIRLHAHELPLTRVMQLLPGGEQHEAFKATVRDFMPSALSVEVWLTPTTDSVTAASLSSTGRPRLGWNAWVSERGVRDTAASAASAETPPPARFSFDCAHHEH
jgi:type VI secretion system protein ImpH